MQCIPMRVVERPMEMLIANNAVALPKSCHTSCNRGLRQPRIREWGSSSKTRQNSRCHHTVSKGCGMSHRKYLIARAADEALESSPESSAVPRHAILHDFCMIFPYGAIITVAGLISLLFGARAAAARVIGAGLLMELAAGYSLFRWRSGNPSRLITVASAGVSISLVRLFWVAAKQSVAPIATYTLAAVSIVMSLFLVYNLGAGGNPPQRDNPKVDEVSDGPQAPVIAA